METFSHYFTTPRIFRSHTTLLQHYVTTERSDICAEHACSTSGADQQEHPAAINKKSEAKKKEKALLDDMYGDDGGPAYAW
jgi:hypothetical protein